MNKKIVFVDDGRKKVFVGLEDSKKKWVICVRSDGEIIKQVTMPAQYMNLNNFFNNNFFGMRIIVIYETGFRGFSLHDKIVQDGHECIVIPANKVTQAKDARVKTDRIDAKRLAEILEMGDVVVCHVPEKRRRMDRQVSRTMVQVQENLKQVKLRIQAFCLQHDIEFVAFNEPWTASVYKRLKDELLLKLDHSLQVCLNVYIKELELFMKLRQDLRKELSNLSQVAPYNEWFKYFKSAPGIGELTAIRFALEWGDLTRFATGKHFASYLGLTGSEFTTAESIRKGHITKQGNGQVRAWLIESAWVAIRFDPVLKKKFNAVKGHKKSNNSKRAIVAVARKLAVRLWYLVTHKEEYTVGLIEKMTVKKLTNK